MSSAAQFFAFFAKTKNGYAKDFSRKMTCEKFAKKGPKSPQNCSKFALKSRPILHSSYLVMGCLNLIEDYMYCYFWRELFAYTKMQ